MLYENQIVSLFPVIVPDPKRPAFTGSGLGPAGLQIRSLAIAERNVLHGGDSEVRFRFLTSTDDDSECHLLRRLGVEDTGVTIVSLEPAVIRSTLRLRTALLLDRQPGGAEAIHRQMSCATWVRAPRATDETSFAGIEDLRERHLAVAVAMLLDELACMRVTPFGAHRFELAAELVKAAAIDAGFEALAAQVARMRLSALQR